MQRVAVGLAGLPSLRYDWAVRHGWVVLHGIGRMTGCVGHQVQGLCMACTEHALVTVPPRQAPQALGGG